MSNMNVVQFPERPRTASQRRVEQLCEAFRAAGRGQPTVFESLSREIERLVAETKARKGEKSGAMLLAFGENHVRMKGRFCAKDGVAPDKICKTPQVWIDVLVGFAGVLERDRNLLVINALEEAMADRRAAPQFGQDAWLADFHSLLAPMAGWLLAQANLPEISDDIARSGLRLEDGRLVASEWPGEVGIESGGLYNPDVLGLTPHVHGLNYEPIADAEFALAETTSDAPLWAMLASNGLAADACAGFTTVQAIEGIRTGLAFAVRADSLLPELAFVEWHVAVIRLLDENGLVARECLATSTYPLPNTFHASPGVYWEPNEGEQRQRPQHWQPNSLRFHFRGEAGFERIAASLIVRPWVYGDPDELEPIFGPEPHLTDEFPLSCPRHSVAGAVEGNLRYCDEMGHPEERLDRKIATQIHRVVSLVTEFRKAGDPRLETTRKVLMNEWKTDGSDAALEQEGSE